ncbi:MAG: hypothetical protein L0G99_07650 [Propionibacteriales bacterium]|nr:hypothetical protein [Propionibacteriales bacterium]
MDVRSPVKFSRIAARRDLMGGFVLVGVFLGLLFIGQGWLVRIGVLPEPSPYRTGTAQIEGCRPALRWAGLLQTCDAQVIWEPVDRWRPGLRFSDSSTVQVLADRSISGEVTVASQAMPSLAGSGGGSLRREMVVAPADKLLGASGWWWLPVVVAPFLGAGTATVVFHRLARRRQA